MCLNACGLYDANKIQTVNYGEKVSYISGNELKFPDFTVKFSGKREVKYPNETSSLKITVLDFTVTKGDKKQTVSWSGGTGDIAPSFFYVDGEDFVLELGQSDVIKGSLGEGILIIWKRTDYETAIRKK
jgi:hypothetical protein